MIRTYELNEKQIALAIKEYIAKHYKDRVKIVNLEKDLITTGYHENQTEIVITARVTCEVFGPSEPPDAFNAPR